MCCSVARGAGIATNPPQLHRTGLPMRGFVVSVWTILVALGALAAAGWAGLGLAGAFSVRADAVNHVAPFALVGSLVVALLALSVRRRARWVLVLAVAATAFQAWRVVPELLTPRPPASAPDSAADLTVVTFNVQGWHLADPGPAAAWIIARDPDIIALQEVHDTGRALQDRLVAAGWRHVMDCPRRDGCGTVLLSRIAPVARSDDAPRRRLPSGWGVFELAGGVRFAVMSVHLSWPLNRPVSAFPPPLPHQARQMATLARTVQTELGPERTIVLGDFNSTPWSFALGRLVHASGLTRWSRAQFSWPALAATGGLIPAPILPIDHVLAGQHWRVVSLARGPDLGSDHYPLIARLAWTGPAAPRSAEAPGN